LLKGGSAYNGAGYGEFIGSPVLDAVAVGGVFMVGEYLAVDGKSALE